MTLGEEIKTFFKGDVEDDARARDRYSRDASLFRVVPELVVFPRDVHDIKKLVKFVRKEREEGRHISITARAAGTDMTGGPLSSSIVMVCTRYLNKLHHIGSDYAVVEPGMYYRDFERETLKHGLIFPSYPASRELCAIGGIVANNAGGEKTLAYGKTERYVRAVKMVLDDGEEYSFAPMTVAAMEAKQRLPTVEGDIYRKLAKLIFTHERELQTAKPQVSKNSAGYALWNVFDRARAIFDPTQLIVGSQGTLGIITEITLGLMAPKKHACMLVIFLKDLKDLALVTSAVLEHKPESFESYDSETIKVAVKFLPQLLRQLGGNIFTLGWRFLPEVLMVLAGGVPKLVLLAEFTANDEASAHRAAAAALEAVKRLRLRVRLAANEYERKKYWLIRRESFNLLRKHQPHLRTAPFIDDIVVRPELLPKFLPELYAVLARYNLLYTVAGHIGDGDFHIIPLMDMSKPESLTIIKKLSSEVNDLTLRYRGSLTGEHNDGLLRGPYLKDMYGEKIYALFEETKKIFDPLGIFNPHKKIGVNPSFALAYIEMEN